MRKLKVVMMASAVCVLAGFGSGRGQVPPSPVSIPTVDITRPPTPEEQRREQYAKLHKELSLHLSDAQLQEQLPALEKELAAARERTAQAVREKAASEELAKAKELLAKVAKTYKATDAGNKAQWALDAANGNGPPPTGLPGPLALPPLTPPK